VVCGAAGKPRLVPAAGLDSEEYAGGLCGQTEEVRWSLLRETPDRTLRSGSRG
jgi:hypothetical protein